MATTVTGLPLSAAERQKRLELRELLNAKYRWIDRSWDAVFWITAIFIVAGAADITRLLFAGDWDFWTDWKDPQWWPVVTAFASPEAQLSCEERRKSLLRSNISPSGALSPGLPVT